MDRHASDCALHNAPAFEPGPCDCGADALTALRAENAALAAQVAELRGALEAIRRCPSDARADWPEIVEWIVRTATAALALNPSAALARARAAELEAGDAAHDA